MLKRLTLKNGLRLLLFPMANTQALTVLFLARTGSKYESKKLNGISHLMEHLIFRATQNWPEPSAIARELDSVGGLYNAFTDKEMLGVEQDAFHPKIYRLIRQLPVGLDEYPRHDEYLIDEPKILFRYEFPYL